jgi:hypothetical protein
VSVSYINGLKNNLPRNISSKQNTLTTFPPIDIDNIHSETEEVTTENLYDAKGNLTGAQGIGKKFSHEYDYKKGWYNPHDDLITVDYVVILGKPLMKQTTEMPTDWIEFSDGNKDR